MLTLQIFIDGRWQDAAELELTEPDEGRNGLAILGYSFDYALDYPDREDGAAVSLNQPVRLMERYRARPWFTFLDDIIPAGASRRYWVNQLGLQGGPAAQQDYALLRHGTIAPVGNMRIKEALPERVAGSQLGQLRFQLEQVVEREVDFLEYAQQMGAASGGATGAGGEAPKLLLRCSGRDEVWIDTWQDDNSCQDTHYLVKFPRGTRSPVDCDILRAEFHYYHELAAMGINTIDCTSMRLIEGSRSPSLWLPRFDVSFRQGRLERHGLESVYSIMGAGPGSYLNYFTVIETLMDKLPLTAAEQSALAVEMVKRDMLNVVFGNSDNHGRNMAIIKRPEGVTLSPVYDFAPMKADPEGIARTTQWGSPFEEGGRFNWLEIAQRLDRWVDPALTIAELSQLAGKLTGLKDRLAQRGVPEQILALPGIGFDYLDNRLEQWGLL